LEKWSYLLAVIFQIRFVPFLNDNEFDFWLQQVGEITKAF
jgi:hypothetical protein